MERSDQRKVLGWGQGTLVEGELTRINQPRTLEKSWRVESFLGSGFSAGVFAAEDQWRFILQGGKSYLCG